MVAPAAPHNEDTPTPVVPQQRHAHLFPNVKGPRHPNYNPENSIQKGKSAWVRDLKLINSTLEEFSDRTFRQRVQSLQGIDELLEDILGALEAKGALENTYC